MATIFRPDGRATITGNRARALDRGTREGMLEINSEHLGRIFEELADEHGFYVVAVAFERAAKKALKNASKVVVKKMAKRAGVTPKMVAQRIGFYASARNMFAQIYVRGGQLRGSRFSLWNFIPLYSDTTSLSLPVSPDDHMQTGRRVGGAKRGKRGYTFGRHPRRHAFWMGKYRNFFDPADRANAASGRLAVRVVARETVGKMLADPTITDGAIQAGLRETITLTLKNMDREIKRANYKEATRRKAHIVARGRSVASFLGF